VARRKARVEERSEDTATPKIKPHFISLKDPIPTLASCHAVRVIDDPQEGAYWLSIRAIGHRLWEITHSVEKMNEILLDQAADDPAHYLKIEIVDHAWDNIGDWHC
jgi:hypothetical protein